MIAALVLAAGQSRRMDGVNKLLLSIDGRPLVARAVDAALASEADPVVVVTGFDAGAVRSRLEDCAVDFVHNADFAAGMGASLRTGIAALPPAVDGVVVCLADMPRVTAAHIDRLIAAFDGSGICVPVFAGRRGNPVLLPRRLFGDIMEIEGDTGARHLIGRHAQSIIAVAMDDDAVLADIDRPGDVEPKHEAIPYPAAILALSDDRRAAGRLQNADGSATLDNPYCGDRVSIDVRVADGVVAEVAHRVRGCVLCEAAAAVVAAAAVGETAAAIAGTSEALESMLAADAPPPGGAWADLAAFVPVRPHKSRHDCVLLPFQALLAAINR